MPVRPTKHLKSRRKTRRVRRDPETARAEILAAARRVFATRGPDAAGLKHVAREAGVSHGLITHYFGTYDALVEAALEATVQEGQRTILERLAGEHRIEAVLDAFFELLEQPQHGRLLAWALLSGRADRPDFFPRRVQAPRRVAEAIEQHFRVVFPDARIDRDQIDRFVLTVLSIGMGFSLGGGLLLEALGRPNSTEERLGFRAWLADVIRTRIAHTMHVALPRSD